MKLICKKMLTLLLAMSMILGMCMTANAADKATSVSLDGKVIETNAYGDKNGRTQIPMETALKLGLSYQQNGNTATFSDGLKELSVTAGGATGDTTAVEGYVPLRFLAEYFGYQVSWNQAARTAELVSPAPVDFDSIEALEIDWSQASQLPLTGYFTKSLENGRSVKVYIAEEASIRSYFTVVAVPDGVDTKSFLTDEGWFALADQKGEGLFVLEPGANGWGTAEDEADYMDSAIAFLKKCVNDNDVSVFSTFGEFYLAAYGESCAAVELWAAQNPILVISQVYVNGKGVSADALAEAGKVEYDGVKAGGYADIPDFEGTLKKVGTTAVTKAEVPVPTWFVNYAAGSANIEYWKSANDVAEKAVDGSFRQSITSDALQTEQANAEILKLDANAKYGISQVKVTSADPTAADIYSFLSIYTRYENSFAYANTLAYRVDYTAARVGAQQQAVDGKAIASFASKNYEGKDVTVELWGKADTKTETGTVQVGVFTFSDNDGDGKNDPREYLVYVPDSSKGKNVPVLIVYPGNTQTDGIFFDCTQWYQVADREGFVFAVVNETYSGPTAITHVDSLYYQTAIMTVLKEVVDGELATLDFSRVYGTGQSLGCMTTQAMARTHPEFFAAVAATSGVKDMGFGEDAGKSIPVMLLVGQSDLEFLLPDLWNSETLTDWANYFLGVNGIKGNTKNGSDYELTKINNLNRVNMYTWENDQGIPMVKWGQTLLRAHNCYAGEMQLLWDFLEHFSYEVSDDGTVTRYYSASAFASDDAVLIK